MADQDSSLARYFKAHGRSKFDNFTMETDAGFKAALSEAQKGSEEGGVPIGACLVGADGKILGQGHNMRIQKSSATLHVSAQPALGAAVDLDIRARSDHLRRQKYQPWRMPDACLDQLTRALQCTPPCRPVICALVPVSCMV